MKKKIFLLITLSSCLFLNACGGTEKTDILETETVTILETEKNYISETETVNYENKYEDQFNNNEQNIVQQTAFDLMDGRVIIHDLTQLFVTNNGIVYSKGSNEYGELGNGSRIDSNEWTIVDGLSDVKGIYARENFGSSSYGDAYEYGYSEYCYALTNSGELYRWGANILSPQKLELPFKISDMHSSGRYLWFRNEDGKAYVMQSNENYVYPFDSLSEDDYIYDNYILLSDKVYYFYESDNYVKEKDSFVNSSSFESMYILIPIDTLGKTIVSANDNCLITNEGSVLYVNDDDYTVTDIGGSGYKKYQDVWGDFNYNYTAYGLFMDGSLLTRYDNQYGQLGDGTTLDYDDSWLTVKEAYFRDFYEYDDTVSALDFNNNVWVWGKGFGNTPEIIISNEMFAGEVW